MKYLLSALLLLGFIGGASAQTINASGQVSVQTGKITINAPPNDVAAGPSNFTSAGLPKTLAVNSQGSGSVGIQVTGTFTGLTANFQGTVDGTNYFTISCFTTGTTGAIVQGVTTTSAVGSWTCPAAGYQNVQVQVTAVASGTAVITLNASAGSAQRPVGTQGTATNITGIAGNAVGDPCALQAKTNVPISTAAGTTALVAGVSLKKIYVCSMLLVAPSAVSVSLAEGSSSTCGTSNQAAVIGVATNGTASQGVPLAANTGWTLGNGEGTIAATATAANYLCLFQSGTAQLAGNLTYVQQ